jgi:hypothetical protein
MSINRNTYEVYLIDYFEGNLDALQVSELLLFLEQNPDLKTECENLELVYLTQDNIAPLDKSSLKKPDFDAVKKQYEPLLIAQLEGDLTVEDAAKLAHATTVYPQIEKEAQLFALTKLVPDLTIKYANKRALKRFVLAAYYPMLIRIAAVLLLFSLVGFYFLQPSQPEMAVANTKNTIIKPEKAVNNIPSTAIASANKPAIKPAEIVSANKVAVATTATNTATAATTLQKENPPQSTDATVEKMVVQAIAINTLQKPRLQDISIDGNYQLSPVQASPLKPIIAATEATTTTPEKDFLTLGAWVKRKINKSLQTEKVVAGINKTGTSFYFQRDTVSGKIRRFEIAGIGFERGN